MRQSVYQLFVAAFVLVIFVVLVVIATFFIRVGFTFGYQFFVAGVPAILRTIWSDPWYVLALVLAVLLVWSWPWEGEGAMPDPVRRGRVVTNFPRATRTTPTRRSAPAGSASTRRSQPAGSRLRRAP